MKVTLSAVPCPYTVLDADGRAQSVVPFYLTHERYVGASRDHAASTTEKVHLFHVQTEPVALVCGDPSEYGYYRRYFEEGHLLPGDAETHKRLNLVDVDGSGKTTPRPFVEPAKALAAARLKAVGTFGMNHGFAPACAHPDYSTAAPLPAEPTPEPASPKAAPPWPSLPSARVADAPDHSEEH